MSDVVRACRRTWRRLGVRRADVRDMAAELEADLAAAAAEGVPARELVGYDPGGFALSWAREKGVAGPGFGWGWTTVAMVVGALPGVAVGLFVAYGEGISNMQQIATGYQTNDPADARHALQRLILALYVVAAIFTYGGALAAVNAVLRWRLDSAAGITVRLLAWSLPAIILCTVGLTIGFSASQGFSTDRAAVIGDLLIPTAALALSVAGIRICAVRRAAGMPAHQPVVIGQTTP